MHSHLHVSCYSNDAGVCILSGVMSLFINVEIYLCIMFYKKIMSSDGSEWFLNTYLFLQAQTLSSPVLSCLSPGFHPCCGSRHSFLTSKKSHTTNDKNTAVCLRKRALKPTAKVRFYFRVFHLWLRLQKLFPLNLDRPKIGSELPDYLNTILIFHMVPENICL